MSDILPGGSDAKKSAWNAGDPGSIPGSGRSPREGNGYPYQYSCLENPLDWSLVGYSPGVAMSRTWLSDYHTHELQHARLLCPLSSRVCSNSCSLSWSCYLIKSTSIIFPAVFLTFWLSVTFWQFAQCFKYFRYYYICCSDLWLVILDVTISKRWQLAKGFDWWWIAFFLIKYV